MSQAQVARRNGDNKVVWCNRDYGEYKYSELKRFADMGRLYISRGKLLVTVFPPEVFEAFERVYILTYMFNGSPFMCYLKRFGFPYERLSVMKRGGVYSLVEYNPAEELGFRNKCKDLISVCHDRRLNTNRKLTKTWYQNAKPEDLKGLKKDIRAYFTRYLQNARGSNGDIMWTCFKPYNENLKGQGYTRIRSLTKEEKKSLSPREFDKLDKQLDCFVPCNARASNEYRARWALAYCVNMFMNQMIYGFFDNCEESPDNDVYALSCMIQWIFRSRIRDGMPIEIYIPNKRMRELLFRWLDGEFV